MTNIPFQVSVITPVYNAERFIRRAVESAIHLPEVSEIILIDDAGPDESLDVCQKLESEYSKVRLIQHPDHRNHGAGASRNLGIKHARCEFIAFLDADDYYLPNRFEKEKGILTSVPTLDGVYGAIGIDYASQEARRKFLDANLAYQEFLTLSASVAPEELIDVLFSRHSKVTGDFHTIAVTVRKSIFDRSGVFDEKLRLQQDTHLWRRLAAVARLAPGSIDRPIAIRGVHESNRMTDHLEQAKYVDYWWNSLRTWFATSPNVSKNAKKTFKDAYCRYRVKNRSKWEGRRAFLAHVARNPRLVLEYMGFFDLYLLQAFGRNWFTLHLTSFKNRVLAKRNSLINKFF